MGNEYHLYVRKNDWKSLTISTKYIIHDILLEQVTDCLTFRPYTIHIQNDKDFGSNLIDIQCLCRIISTNNLMKKLKISNCKHLLEWNKFHFFVQHSFLKMLNHDVTYQHLTEICIDSYKHFNDECFQILMDVIDSKCPSLTHLSLYRTDISNESVKELIAFLTKNENRQHPLWSIDIEFCPKINDKALDLLCNYLQMNPVKKMYIKCTYSGKNIQNDRIGKSNDSHSQYIQHDLCIFVVCCVCVCLSLFFFFFSLSINVFCDCIVILIFSVFYIKMIY